jgi:pimeloyl-ACP methyl ester carboxylesterase
VAQFGVDPLSDNRFIDWTGLGGVPASAEVCDFDDLVQLVLSLLDEPAALVAQSMGGVVAVRSALERPASVSHLVLAATSGGVDMSSALDWRPNYRHRWPDAPSCAFERPDDLSQQLSTLTTPTLLLWATRDPISQLEVGERLFELLENSRLALVDTAERMFAPDHAERVAAKISRHLATSGALPR